MGRRRRVSLFLLSQRSCTGYSPFSTADHCTLFVVRPPPARRQWLQRGWARVLRVARRRHASRRRTLQSCVADRTRRPLGSDLSSYQQTRRQRREPNLGRHNHTDCPNHPFFDFCLAVARRRARDPPPLVPRTVFTSPTRTHPQCMSSAHEVCFQCPTRQASQGRTRSSTAAPSRGVSAAPAHGAAARGVALGHVPDLSRRTHDARVTVCSGGGN